MKISVKEKAPKKRAKKIDTGKLHDQLRRLNNIYIAGNISDGEYTAQADALRAAISAAERQQAAEEKPVNLDAMREIIGTDFEGHYKSLTREERQRFWRSIIEEIHFDDNQVSEIIFRA